ncbi:MAG: phosphohistidine phosphatase SixA [bacterium]
MVNKEKPTAIKMLYLVQHGEAKPETEDPRRPLSEHGQKQVRSVASWAAEHSVEIDEIRHSGKLRAEETARLFAQTLHLENRLKAVSGLAPLDEVEPWAKSLSKETGTIMLVGHLPFLNHLASRLLINEADKTVVRFQNGGLVGLRGESGSWSVALVVPPSLE